MKKVRVFGSAATFQIEYIYEKSETQTGTHDQDPIIKNGVLGIEISPITNKTADYSKKTMMELSTQDVVLLAAVLNGFLPKTEFKRPGKSFNFERQHSKIYVSGSGQSGKGALPVNIADTAIMSAFVLNHLCLSLGVSGDLVLHAIKGAAALFRLPNPS